MEGKMMRAAALGCLLVILVSCQLQGGAADSQFCSCFKTCYPLCGKSVNPTAVCVPQCLYKCSPDAKVNNCNNVCELITQCDLAAIEVGAPDLKDCVHDCQNFPGAPAANLN